MNDRQDWVEARAAITPEEWMAIVQSDPELTLNKQNAQHYPLYADWSGPGEYPCWLDYSDGALYSKNPTEEIIEKMVQIAKLLDARVVGEEGEEYLGDRRVAVLLMDMTTGELTGRQIYSGTEPKETMP